MKNNDLENTIIAYTLEKRFKFDATKEWLIKPAPRKRMWMEETGWYTQDSEGNNVKYHAPHAYKCLPLVIANQLGWVVCSPVGFTAVWNGENKASSGAVRFEFDEEQEKYERLIIDRFGVGTFTFPVPYVFQTPADTQLMTRGPTNSWKTNCQSLDAVMESDWLPYPFFQTWKIKRPWEPVRFNKGEPYAMIHPVSLGQTKDWEFKTEPIENNQELYEEYDIWTRRRQEFQANLRNEDMEWREKNGDWQKDYSRGRYSDGSKTENHYPSLGKREVSRCPFANLWRKDDEGQSQDDS